mmetsp:Transcript_8089/g.12106  ORF Transcript_8089/g.12106 Transcript_8089/m.12106 type:complete len:152 (+) Transcript_8089:37-492(+)
MMASNRMARAACRFSRPMQQNNSAVLSRPFCGTAEAPSPAWNKQVAVLPSPSSLIVQQSSVESQLWRTALQDIKKKQQDEINNLQWLKDSLRAAQMTPPTTTVTTSPAQNTFQIMNRNARKPKRANHGKRPCSRVRRRWKTRSWANTSRRG